MNLSKLEKVIEYTFTNKDILKEALTHRSYINEKKDWELHHNERIEFLGDAVFELVTSEYLFKHYEHYTEGKLTSIRASLVNAHMLCRIAREIGLESHILLSKGESKDLGKARDTILANAAEALIGAIYLDSGLDNAKIFVQKFVIRHLPEVLEKKLWKDPKSLLQETIQEKTGATPVYKVLDEWGPDHKKIFKIGVYFNENLEAEGEGESKQEAEVEAAKNYLDNHKV